MAPPQTQMKITDDRIRFLFEAWRCGSMRAAADILDLAPSSISRQIAQLEAETGTSLIEPGRREIRLTDAGHAVIDYYRARQSSVEVLEAQLLDLAAARAGHAEIAIGEGFLGPDFHETLDGFINTYPGITLSVSVTDTTKMIRLLLDDEVHFGVAFNPVSHPHVVSRYRAALPLVAILSAHHRLAQRSSLSMEDLGMESLALMGPNFRIRQLIDEAATNNGLRISPIFTSNSIALLTHMARAHGVITVLPAFSVSAELASGELVAVPVATPELQAVYVHLLARRGRRFAPHLNELADLIRKRLLPSARVSIG